MELQRGQETINHPLKSWTDETGKTWEWPTLAFMQKRGFVEVVPTPPTAEEIRLASIPFEVTMRQARVALSRSGLLDDVETLVAQIGGEAQIVWEYSSMVQRTNPLVAVVMAQAGWTTEQVDDLFILAATL